MPATMLFSTITIFSTHIIFICQSNPIYKLAILSHSNDEKGTDLLVKK